MKKLTDKEILDWLDSQTKKPHAWTVSQNQNEFTFLNNSRLTTCEEERGQTFRKAICKFIIKNNEKTN